MEKLEGRKRRKGTAGLAGKLSLHIESEDHVAAAAATQSQQVAMKQPQLP